MSDDLHARNRTLHSPIAPSQRRHRVFQAQARRYDLTEQLAALRASLPLPIVQGARSRTALLRAAVAYIQSLELFVRNIEAQWLRTLAERDTLLFVLNASGLLRLPGQRETQDVSNNPVLPLNGTEAPAGDPQTSADPLHLEPYGPEAPVSANAMASSTSVVNLVRTPRSQALPDGLPSAGSCLGQRPP